MKIHGSHFLVSLAVWWTDLCQDGCGDTVDSECIFSTRPIGMTYLVPGLPN